MNIISSNDQNVNDFILPSFAVNITSSNLYTLTVSYIFTTLVSVGGLV